MRRWNIMQTETSRGTCFRVRGSTTRFYSAGEADSPGVMPLSDCLQVITQRPSVLHPGAWPCRQTGAAQLELDSKQSERMIKRLKLVLESTVCWI